jgi:uncharacterized membrane protein
MASVTAITFEDMEQGPQVREALKDLERRNELSLDDAAVIVRDEQGKFHVKGQADRGVKVGAVAGGAMGLLLASIFFPIGGIVLGALAGAGVGAVAHIGIDKQFIKDVEAAMPNGSSAVIIYAREGNPAAVRAALEPFHGEIFQTSLEGEDEEALHRALDS